LWVFGGVVDGLARIMTVAFGELRNAMFASISQGAIRKVARETFEHLLNMDMKFHLERQTGGLTRAIDRGTKWVRPVCGWAELMKLRGISFILSSIVFHVIPTALEISMVCGILVSWHMAVTRLDTDRG
jgi:ATP-binding cassette subfamily B (MDR/TAP) protein 7